MEKINIAELLKDCPKGMELDCTMYENVYFEGLVEDTLIEFPILVNICDDDGERSIRLTKEGCWSPRLHAKCVIFPKGKTTWKGFVSPCKFKDGDIVATDSGRWLGIIKNKYNSGYYTVHCAIDYTFNDIFYRCGEYCFSRLATEEEKEKLFQAIKDNGYKWNAKTKTLERLIKPKFKVGDRVRLKSKPNYVYTINSLTWDDNNKLAYRLLPDNDKHLRVISLITQDQYELVPNKFDITTLVPFESKVLVRNDESQYWIPAFWGCKRADGYTTTFGWCKYCIPYEGNEHLLGTTNDCDEYFKTWK